MSAISLEEIMKSVVRVTTANGTGSGICSQEHGVVITNFHVVAGFREVAIETHDLKRIKCRVAVVNPDADVALLVPSTMPAGLRPLLISEKTEVQNRDRVTVVGWLTTCKFRSAENVGFALPAKKILAELNELNAEKMSGLHIRCGSCETYANTSEEHCGNCGTEMDMSLFEEYRSSATETFIEQALAKGGIDPIEARMGHEYWVFHSGSALVRVFISAETYLFATSPIVNMPNQKLEELYRYLLEFQEAPYYLGISDKTVYLSCRVHLSDLLNSDHQVEMQEKLAGFLKRVDELDNKLIQEFGCKPSQHTNFTKEAA